MNRTWYLVRCPASEAEGRVAKFSLGAVGRSAESVFTHILLTDIVHLTPFPGFSSPLSSVKACSSWFPGFCLHAAILLL